jgi:NTP pyrophosphatase (non-canonical NTP hydrolase)
LNLQEANIDRDEKFNSLKNELEEVKAELLEIEKKWESGEIFSYKQSEYWQDLEDLKDELEKELAQIEQYHTPVKKDSYEKENKPQEEPAEVIPLSAEAKPEQFRHAKLNFRYSEDYNLYPKGAKTKYKNNIEAIKLLKRIENEKRLANPEEQIILARYVGWGGLANAFSDTASGWENEHTGTKSLT